MIVTLAFCLGAIDCAAILAAGYFMAMADAAPAPHAVAIEVNVLEASHRVWWSTPADTPEGAPNVVGVVAGMDPAGEVLQFDVVTQDGRPVVVAVNLVGVDAASPRLVRYKGATP